MILSFTQISYISNHLVGELRGLFIIQVTIITSIKMKLKSVLYGLVPQ